MAEETKPEAAPAASPEAAAATEGKKRKSKKNILHGVVHVQATFNNTLITITDTMGNVLSLVQRGRTRLQREAARARPSLLRSRRATPQPRPWSMASRM